MCLGAAPDDWIRVQARHPDPIGAVAVAVAVADADADADADATQPSPAQPSWALPVSGSDRVGVGRISEADRPGRTRLRTGAAGPLRPGGVDRRRAITCAVGAVGALAGGPGCPFPDTLNGMQVAAIGL